MKQKHDNQSGTQESEIRGVPSSDLLAEPCPECLDTGWMGDQGPGCLYFNDRPTGNAEYVPCQCDPSARAARRIANTRFPMNSPDPQSQRTMPLAQWLGICVHSDELIAQYDRLKGTNLSRKGSGLSILIDDSTGKYDSDAKAFLDFCVSIYPRVSK